MYYVCYVYIVNCVCYVYVYVILCVCVYVVRVSNVICMPCVYVCMYESISLCICMYESVSLCVCVCHCCVMMTALFVHECVCVYLMYIIMLYVDV